MKIGLKVLLIGVGLLFVSCSTKEVDKPKTIQRVSTKPKQYSRVALIIGNKDYKRDRLKHTIEDSKKINDFLLKRGFAILYRENVKTKEEFIKLLNSSLNQTTKNGTFLFYFSGHGSSVYNKNFLIPTSNSSIYRKEDIQSMGYSINHLLQSIEKRGNLLSIVMLDNCRNNIYKGSNGFNSSGLLRNEAKGVYIAYSTKEGEVAMDNGLFASSFIKNAKKSGWNVEDVFKGIRKDVFKSTEGEQVPFSTNGTMQDFYFTPQTYKSSSGNSSSGFWKGVILTLILVANGFINP